MVLLVSTVALLVPGLAGAVAVTRPAGQEAGSTAPAVMARQWRVAQLAAMHRIAAGRGVVAGPNVAANAPDEFSDNASLISAGDLTGKHRRDVLDVRFSPYSPTANGAVGITARDGRTGRALWTRKLTQPPNDDTEVMPERVGAAGKLGVLVIESYETLVSNAVVYGEVRVRALAGASGKPLWTRTITGTFGTGEQTKIPELDGVFHNVKGPDSSVFVSLQTDTNPATDYESTPETVSAVNGSLRVPGGSFTSTADYPNLLPIGDVNGDGLADILVLSPGSPGYERAEKGNTGAKIWQTSVVPIQPFSTGAMVLGHYSSRAYPDLAILAGSLVSDTSQITVLAGRTGHVLWTRTAGGLYLLGKAGKHLVPAVGLQTQTSTATSTTFSASVRFEAVSASNRVIYNRVVTASVAVPSGPLSTGSTSDIVPLGDVEPDGSIERAVYEQVTAQDPPIDNTKTVEGYVDGRLGGFRPVIFGSEADGSLRNGNGTDLLALTVISGRLHLTAIDGKTRKAYYKRTLAALSGVEAASVTGIRVSAQKCSDLSVATVGSSRSVLGITSARARWLWRVSFTANQLTGGARTHPKAPKHYCV